VPEWGVLRNPETQDLLDSPFLRGVVALIFVAFLVPGIRLSASSPGTFKSDRDVIDGMAAAMSSLGLYIVLVFFAAQFVAFFGWTNLGAIVAVTGAGTLNALGFTGTAALHPVHPGLRLHQPHARQCIGAVGGDGARSSCPC
jgi:aminobenzoyl-glutamate transport protein